MGGFLGGCYLELMGIYILASLRVLAFMFIVQGDLHATHTNISNLHPNALRGFIQTLGTQLSNTNFIP